MARKQNPIIDGRITRTITFTSADVVKVTIIDGKPSTTTGKVVLPGDYKGDSERFRAACIAMGGEYASVAVALNLDTDTALFECTVSEFLSVAHRVEDVDEYDPEGDVD